MKFGALPIYIIAQKKSVAKEIARRQMADDTSPCTGDPLWYQLL
jgi:hypothetical protein